MRKSILILAAFSFVVVTACYAKSPNERIVGSWKGADPTGATATLVLNKDGTAEMIQGNVVLHSSSVRGTVTWRLDSGHDPMYLDLVLRKDSTTIATLPMIVRFIGKNKIEVRASNDGETRPIRFTDSPNPFQAVLTRQ